MVRVHKTIQRRVYLRRNGHERLNAVMRNCAVLYNAALDHWRGAYKATRHQAKPDSVSDFALFGQLTGVRADDPHGWRALDVEVGRGVIRRLGRARQSFFRRVKEGTSPGYPRFKAGARWRTIEIEDRSPNMVRVVEERGKAYIRVKGLPTMEMRLRRIDLPPSEQLKSIRITRYPTGVYASLTYEIEAETSPPSEEAVGIDMGVNKRMALSDGGFAPFLLPTRRPEQKKQKRLRRKMARQREIARHGRQKRQREGKPLDVRAEWRPAGTTKRGKIKFRHAWLSPSKSYEQTRRQLAALEYREQIRNRNGVHRVTTDIVARYGVIVVEDLIIPNMTASASGTLETPGKGVARKRGLNRSILEQNWGLMRQQLSYKAEWAGRDFVEVAPHYTSQTCLRCGVVDARSREGEQYSCRNCGWEFDADVNAAENIRREGLKALGRECTPRRGDRRKNKGIQNRKAQPPLDPFAT